MAKPTRVALLEGYQSMQRPKALAEEHEAELFFSHDSASYQHYLKAPAWYG